MLSIKLCLISFTLFFIVACSGGRGINPVAGRDYYDGRKEGVELSNDDDNPIPPTVTYTPEPGPTWTPTATPRPAATWTPTPTPISPIKNSNLPQISGTCSPNKCHIQGFTGGLLVSAYGQTFGLFNSGQWFVENISDQEAQAVEHFKCATKPDLDSRVKWGFNIAYCRFHQRGAKLDDPFDEGGPIEGGVFQSIPQGIEVNFKGRYGLNKILIKADGTWEFLN